MRLGFVTCHFPPDSIGGGQMQSMRLCEALSAKHEVTVFTRSYHDHLPLLEQTSTYRLQRRTMLKLPVVRSAADLVKGLRQIRASRSNIQVYISFHVQLAALMVILAKFFYKTKAVVSPRGLEDFDFRLSKRKFQKFIYANADLILIQSEKIRTAFIEGMKPHFTVRQQERIIRKIHIFPNGIRVAESVPQPVSGRPDQIVFVGRLEAIKGISYLLEAFRSLPQGTRLVVIGQGSLRSQLEEAARGLNVTFRGQCGEAVIREELDRSRALVLPSLSENFPNVILEAFSAGLPVIGTAVGAIPELIEDGVTGYLVPPTQPAVLAEKIRLLLEDERKLDEMGARAYRKVQRYDWRHLVDKFDQIIDAI